MPKTSHYNIFYILRYAHVRYVKCLFTNIQKQWNVLKINSLFKKFANFTGKFANSIILKIRNGEFARQCFYINTDIYGDFQIYISVP